MSQPTIGIVGNGFVGKATARCFMEHAAVKVYDRVPELSTHDFNEVVRCDYVFICLPTPSLPDGRCDTSALDEFFRCDLQDEPLFVIKSTVPIGYTKSIAERCNKPPLGMVRVVHSPEFLTARCAIVDAQLPARMIVGIPPGVSDLVANGLVGLYRQRFPGTQVLVMSSTESELVKLTCNSFFAVKVWFFNEARIISDKLGLDWQHVIEGVLTDGRIAHAHTKVPGRDGRGFSGACLPKDLASFATEADGRARDVFFEILGRNQEMRLAG